MSSKLNGVTRLLKDALREFLLVASLSIDIKPVPASRPRVTRWGTYHLKPYKNWLTEAQSYIKAAEEVTQNPLVVLVCIYGKKAKTTKRPYPVGDVDNYAKGTLDAINHNEKVWEDDDQVVGLWVTKQYAEPGEERTEVSIYEIRE